jgi:hypothetical protein
MQLKPGMKLGSSASTAQFIVIRASERNVEMTCAGGPVSIDAAAGDNGSVESSLLVGKRYRDSEGEFEIMCTAAGAGPLRIDDEDLAEAQAKQLPSSD